MATTVEKVGIQLSAEGVPQTTAGLEATGTAAKNMGREVREAGKQLDQFGNTARQTANAMRQLPAQAQDVVVSLASGQNVMTVLLQQGSQVVTMFGSFRGAANAITSVVPLSTMALVGMGGAVAALAGLMYTGSQEAASYQRALIMSGNVSGLTASQLQLAAQGVEALGAGTQREALPVIMQLASVTRLSQQELERLTATALRLEAVGGPAAAETAQAFADLARAPLDASVRLNQQVGHLTVSTYQHIKALMEQGKHVDAARVAIDAYAQTMAQRTPQLEEQIGSIERAWLGVNDALMGLGRQAPIDQQIAATAQKMTELQRQINQGGRKGWFGEPLEDAQSLQLEMAQLQQQMAGLVKQRDDARAKAQQDSAQRQATTNAIAADKLPKAKTGGRSGISDAERELQAQQRLLLELNGLNADYATDLQRLQRIRAAGNVDEAEYVRLVTELISKQPFAREQARQKADAERDAARAAEQHRRAIQQVTNASQRDADQLDGELAQLREHTARIGLDAMAVAEREQALIDQRIAEVATQLAVMEGADGYDDHTAALRRQLAALQALREAKMADATTTVAKKAADDTRRTQEQEAKEREQRITSLSDDVATGLATGFKRGKTLGKLFLDELEAQFAKAVLSPLIKPVVVATDNIIKALLGSMVGMFSGGGTAGAGASTVAGGGGLKGTLPLTAGGYHQGGSTSEPSFTRTLPAAVFANAPRFHTGIGPGELAAVIRKEEGVFTPGQMAAMAPVSALKRAAGGTRITYAPNISIDARSDQAQVAQLVGQAVQQGHRDLLEMMDRGQT